MVLPASSSTCDDPKLVLAVQPEAQPLLNKPVEEDDHDGDDEGFEIYRPRKGTAYFDSRIKSNG